MKKKLKKYSESFSEKLRLCFLPSYYFAVSELIVIDFDSDRIAMRIVFISSFVLPFCCPIHARYYVSVSCGYHIIIVACVRCTQVLTFYSSAAQYAYTEYNICGIYIYIYI